MTKRYNEFLVSFSFSLLCLPFLLYRSRRHNRSVVKIRSRDRAVEPFTVINGYEQRLLIAERKHREEKNREGKAQRF